MFTLLSPLLAILEGKCEQAPDIIERNKIACEP
jgi:hypothetical protein